MNLHLSIILISRLNPFRNYSVSTFLLDYDVENDSSQLRIIKRSKSIGIFRGREIILLSNVRKENIHNGLHKSLSTIIQEKV